MAIAPLEVAVCGAGPAGLATALYLQRLGHRPTIFERFDTPKAVGSGLILQPTGQAVLHDLGLLDAMRRRGARIERMTGHGVSGRVVLDVRYDALPRGGQGLAVHRAALFDVLHDAVLGAGIPIRTRRQVTALRDLPDDRRALIFEGDTFSEGFDLVIDCLGTSSPLRVYSASPSKSKALEYGAIWATLPWHGEGFDEAALLQRYRRASVMVGILPIGSAVPDGPKLAALFWSLKVADYPALLAGGLDAWKRHVAAVWPETEPYLADIDSFETMTLARYAHYTMGTPIGRGIAFVGDSGHSASPQLGQGANMALLDARALFLALEAHPDNIEAALARYAKLRRGHVRLYQWLTAVFTPFYQSSSRVLPLIRDFFVSYLSRVPPAPQFLAVLVKGSLLAPLRRLGLKVPPDA